MASKEDILEQLVEEFLIHRDYFVRHNVKFLPRRDHPDFVSNQDSNHSDIDVIGFNPKLTGPDRVWAVSCKSWQSGLNPAQEIKNIQENKTIRGREAWRGFRELVVPKWSEAFIASVKEATGEQTFTYVTAVTHLKGSAQVWEMHPQFISSMKGNPIKVITLKEMLHEVSGALSQTVAGTEFGRTLQLFKAAGIKLQD
ncbi:hypothetical protein G3580_05490 [Nitrogeniibacter mangrovi]|uniref:NERD domain-containing protein n=1 Tax=Nitrogeniibacter mangrovi TaxID=2016596 RepID=A0A6C1B4L7_9RHOO|nr:hypothetical protein [Nitrogeniibacter mangrovi]QID17144.1 hypothetical protein G3580_05490 [Nitrogeniibacter mangrovi]